MGTQPQASTYYEDKGDKSFNIADLALDGLFYVGAVPIDRTCVGFECLCGRPPSGHVVLLVLSFYRGVHSDCSNSLRRAIRAPFFAHVLHPNDIAGQVPRTLAGRVALAALPSSVEISTKLRERFRPLRQVGRRQQALTVLHHYSL